MRIRNLCLLVLVLLLPGATAASAAESSLTMIAWTVDAGGGTSTGPAYSISGTMGQHDAGIAAGGDYTVLGGFWSGGQLTQPEARLFMPIVRR